MAEVVLQFEIPVTDTDGRVYFAAACVREAEEGRWEGWLEFDAHDGSDAIHTPRETTQPTRDAVAYWASGLGAIYLQGALARARRPRWIAPSVISASPKYDAPAESMRFPASSPSAHEGETRAILDPFAVHAQGEDVLRQELSALDAGHLRNILRAYDLIPVPSIDLQVLDRVALSELIVAAVRSPGRSSH